jgi:uncharacterized protein (DUF2384 family)
MRRLPTYDAETLREFAVPALIERLIADEDRAPRSLIDECAARGAPMVEHLAALIEDEDWHRDVSQGEWWLRLHAVKILGLVPTERAGLLLVAAMRRMERAGDHDLQDWLAGYWPALFRNKPETVVPPLKALALDRHVDWYMRIQAVEAVIAMAESRGPEALERELDWAAAIAADAAEDRTMRFVVGSTLLDQPRERHRALLEALVAQQQRAHDPHFDGDDVQRAFGARPRALEWRRHFADPWQFYEPNAIAARQQRWGREARAAAAGRDPWDDPAASLASVEPKIGRNDPCPCGSGKKYKKCCLAKAQAAPAEELAWRRLRRMLDDHQLAMLRFFRNTYGARAIDEAWRVFMRDEQAVFDAESAHLQVFLPWLFHFWSPDPAAGARGAAPAGAAPTLHYLRSPRRIDPLLRAYLESCLAAPLSVFEIVRADPGVGLLLRDVLSGEERRVTERSASHHMEEGDLVFGQIGEAGGVAILEACQAFVVPPIHKIEVLALRRRLGADEAAPSRQQLRERHADVVALYREIAQRILNPRIPKLRNTDGEALSTRRVVFDVPSAQEAFDALKHLALESDAELLREATRDADGKLARVGFGWLKRGNDTTPALESTVLGWIEINGRRLTAEVNSAEREQRLRALVVAALGERARYRATEIQSLERALAEGPRSGAATDSVEEAKRLAELPEVRALVGDMFAKHYERWISEKLPALGNRTPLEAVADPDGREAVEALIAQIERDGERMQPPLDPAIPRGLRTRLGLAL